MLKIYLIYYFLPYGGALALGVVVALIGRRRSIASPSRSARTLTATGSVIAFAFMLAPFLTRDVPFSQPVPGVTEFKIWLGDTPLKYTLPLIAGSIAILLMALAPAPKETVGSANLMRRSTFAFTRRSELIWVLAAAVAALSLAIAAGRASSLDHEGHYRMYNVDAGVMLGGVEIYGWYFSVPALIAIGLLLVATFLALWRIATPPLAGDTELETANRKLRSDWVTRTALAAILVHLGNVSTFLAVSASMKISARVNDSGPMLESWPQFAALGPALKTMGIVLSIVGIALWSSVFWRSALGASRKPAPVTAATTTAER